MGAPDVTEISDRYRTVGRGMTRVVEAVPDDAWDNPAPCEGWVARDVVRRALVETLQHGSRSGLVEALDETLLGLRPRPQSALRVA